jgi:hypothetical protein
LLIFAKLFNLPLKNMGLFSFSPSRNSPENGETPFPDTKKPGLRPGSDS